MLKTYLQKLLNRFINVNEKPNLGTLDIDRIVENTLNCTDVTTWNSTQITAPFSGFVILYTHTNCIDSSIRKASWGDYARNGIPENSNGRWQTLNSQVKEGEQLIFEIWPKETGTAIIRFIPYKNT